MLHARKPLVAGQAHAVADLRQPQVGVVLAQKQAVFASAGHHAVGLVRALGRQVVHQHADIGLVAAEDDALPALHKARGVDACQNALRAGLLVAAGAVDLAREVQTIQRAQRQVRAQLQGIDALVLDRVRQTQHARATKAGNRVQHGDLHVLRQRGGQALHIPLVGIKPLRLQKQLVALLVCKAHDLVLDGGTVARAGALDRALVHGRAVDVLADDAVRLRVGVGQVALRAVGKRTVRHERERGDDLVAGLRLHLVKVDGALLDARRRAGLEPTQRDAQPAQRARQLHGGEQTLRAALPAGLADDDAAVHVHAGADDGGLAGDLRAGGCANAGDCAALSEDLAALALAHLEIWLAKERALHPLLIGALVRLRAQGVDGRALARVEHAGLDERVVDGAAHLAAQRVDFTHQMAFARAADGGIAGHERDRVEIEREQQRMQAHARARQRRFAARVTGADDDDIKTIHTILRKPQISKGYYSTRRQI